MDLPAGEVDVNGFVIDMATVFEDFVTVALGDETVTIEGLEQIKPRQRMVARVSYADGRAKEVPVLCRIDTLDELDDFKNGGILQYVLRDLAA